jgi:hypothetical protein
VIENEDGKPVSAVLVDITATLVENEASSLAGAVRKDDDVSSHGSPAEYRLYDQSILPIRSDPGAKEGADQLLPRRCIAADEAIDVMTARFASDKRNSGQEAARVSKAFLQPTHYFSGAGICSSLQRLHLPHHPDAEAMS